MKIFGVRKLNTVAAHELAASIGSISGFQSHVSLPKDNIKQVETLVTAGNLQPFYIAHYIAGQKIVELGRTLDAELLSDNDFSYSDVPLGFIIKGEVTVTKGGKATKKLSEGDFIGLFETSDWLTTDRKRNIGDWTLMTTADTQIIYFSKVVLRDPVSKNFCDYLISIARSDQVPQPITELPLLDWVASHTTKSRLPNYGIVMYTHILPNSFPLFRHLAHLVGFGRMYVLEKPYSTVSSVRNDLVKSGCEIVEMKMEPGIPYEFAVRKSADVLWSRVHEDQKREGFNKLLLIDDGGDLSLTFPWDKFDGVSVAAVQQTQRGVARLINSKHKIPPTVSVASSGVKKIVESMFIGDSVVEKLQGLGELESKKVGVLGLGSIGKAVKTSLEKLNTTPLFYDPGYTGDDVNARRSIDALFNDSDIVIGTTGTDSLKGVAFERIVGEKTVASATSADVEFASLLKLALPTQEPFGTRDVQVHDTLKIRVLNGGYPINFDREKNATASEDIVLTRCLMYIGAMQAVNMLASGKRDSNIYYLDTISQQKMLERWSKEKGEHSPVASNEIEGIVGATATEGQAKFPGKVWLS